ncbi:spore germination lipoprotein GerD [Bacillus sp. SG-1]|uniref:spore germination lipoprotein GerD n=1 Tax=Bacillus sp. SG-1 TaxID=161544 RepID=UPI0001544C75|nr:spore germination lipoprotein GerD [Bacillus sp. SG-1]EDL63071.1 GerD [Bacillus sp. SG-1]
MKKLSFLFLLLPLIFLSACGGGGGEASASQPDYEETKKMVVDILKTDDGKKAIQDIMSDEKMKQQLIMDEGVVKETIMTTLTSDKGSEFWKKSFEDPKFAEAMAKSMKGENEKLLKDLMKDPEYQGMFIEILKDPEIQKEIGETLKSKEYREHLQQVMTETFESPLFKAKIQDLLIKAAGEMQGQGGEEGGQEGGGGESGGGEGGSDDSGGGEENS